MICIPASDKAEIIYFVFKAIFSFFCSASISQAGCKLDRERDTTIRLLPGQTPKIEDLQPTQKLQNICKGFLLIKLTNN